MTQMTNAAQVVKL